MILDISFLLFLFIICLPLISGIFIVFVKSANPSKVLLFETGLLIAGSIGLLLLGEKTIFTELSFLSETITFSISNTALLFTLGIFFALSVLIYRNSLIIGNTISRFQATLLNLSLTFGFVALMSGQFMIRYIALDIVGLLVALTVLNSFSEKTSFKDFAIVFQILRLGDLSLLVSILLINQYAGTLDISLMINAASDLRMEPRMWVFMGFLFAILIKLAIWPFGAWLQRAKNSVPPASFWISGFLMPTLGYYLLYRIIPIINSSIIFQSITFLSGLLLIFILLIATHLRLTAYKRFYHIGSIFSCFSLLAVAFSSHDQIGFYLFGLILYRLILFCQEEVKSPILEKLVLIFPLLINGMYLWANAGNLPIFFTAGWIVLTGFMIYWDWKKASIQEGKDKPISAGIERPISQPMIGEKLSKFAHWLNQKLEINIFTTGFVKLSDSFIMAAQWLNQNIEINIFTMGFMRLGDSFTKIAAWIQENAEQGFENAWSWIGQKFMKVSKGAFYLFEQETPEKTGKLMNEALNSLQEYERNVLKIRLRWDLALIPLFLIIILVFLFIF